MQACCAAKNTTSCVLTGLLCCSSSHRKKICFNRSPLLFQLSQKKEASSKICLLPTQVSVCADLLCLYVLERVYCLAYFDQHSASLSGLNCEDLLKDESKIQEQRLGAWLDCEVFFVCLPMRVRWCHQKSLFLKTNHMRTMQAKKREALGQWRARRRGNNAAGRLAAWAYRTFHYLNSLFVAECWSAIHWWLRLCQRWRTKFKLWKVWKDSASCAMSMVSEKEYGVIEILVGRSVWFWDSFLIYVQIANLDYNPSLLFEKQNNYNPVNSLHNCTWAMNVQRSGKTKKWTNIMCRLDRVWMK